MGLKISKYLVYLVLILMLSNLSRQQTTPEERCEETGNGTFVCIDCSTSGTCLLVDGTYTVTENFVCFTSPQTFCDDSISEPGSYGQCSPLPATYTTCGCSSTTQCIADPNNPAVILHCEETPPVSDEACSPPAVDLTTCSCLSCSDTCPLLDDPDDDCGSYFVCSGTELISVTCLDDLCFDQDSCGCLDSGGSSSELPSTAVTGTIATIPTTAATCPSGCPFLDNPDDSCGSYFVCSGAELIPIQCTGTLCFDQALCGCLDTGASSTEPPITDVTEPGTLSSSGTATTCPSGCPFLDDPNDSCGNYFVCSDGELVPVKCTGTLCFDQELCGCLDAGASSTEPPITDVTEPGTLSSSGTSMTCSEDCPLLDDPDDSCGKYFVCSGDELVPQQCLDNFCFDQESCGCLDSGASSIETPATKVTEPSVTTTKTSLSPVTSVTCPSDCPLLDDPDDSCGKYFVCAGGELTPVECVGSLCFDQDLCGCLDTGASSVGPTTTLSPVTSVTCPPGCPFLDDPDDSCGNYFVCDDGELIPLKCTGTLCFDQASCGCLDRGASSTVPPITEVTVPTTTSSPVTSVTCPQGCPFLDDPDDSCGNYFVCTGTSLIPISCTGTLCFDQSLCGCVDAGGSSTEQPASEETEPIATTMPTETTTPTTTTPTTTTTTTTPTIPPTPTTCPPGCPFVDDPYDDCEKFYICNGGALIPSQCPGILCFDQAACQCL